jgi:hypothetical protein
MLSYVIEVIKLLKDIRDELREINMKLNNNGVVRPIVSRPRVRTVIARVVTRNR